MPKYLLLYLLFSIVACKQSGQQPIDPDIRYSDSLWNVISGKWGGETGGAVWKIKKDSITFYNVDSSYPCWLKKDTFFVKLPERDTAIVWGTFGVSGDTLKLVERWNDGSKSTTYAYRVK